MGKVTTYAFQQSAKDADLVQFDLSVTTSMDADLPGRYATAFIASADNLPGRFPRVLVTLV